MPFNLPVIEGLYGLSDIQQTDLAQKLEHYYLSPYTILGENSLAELFYTNDSGAVLRLSFESGESETVCDSLKDFQETLTGKDGNQHLALTLLHDWERINNRKLQLSERLLPVTPFIMGGQFDPSNLRAVPRDELIGYLINIYVQTHDFPDGTQIKLQVTE